MIKLNTLQEVLYALSEYEILVTLADNKKVYFILKKDKIKVRGENISYYLTIDEFKNLYGEYPFYIYEDTSNEVYIDKEKDDEYYSWWHK